MEMKPTEKLDFDFSDWSFCRETELEKLIEPFIAKACAEAIQNTLTDDPPYLSFGGGVEDGLTVHLLISGLNNSSWEASLDHLVLDHTIEWTDEERCEIASALRALADRVEAQTVKT